MQWELEYYEWVHYDGPEGGRPRKPGPHPDASHQWNQGQKVLSIQDVCDGMSEENDDVVDGWVSTSSGKGALKNQSYVSSNDSGKSMNTDVLEQKIREYGGRV